MRHACVVIGAGAAGLAVSRALLDAGVEHLVLERNEVANTWRTQRWDSFKLNTPGWMNEALGVVDPTSFASRDDVIALLAAQGSSLPVREHATVSRLDRDGDQFAVHTEAETIHAQTVVLASGLRNVAVRPSYPGLLASGLLQLHTRDYRSADALPAGAVLVIGGAQSGCQIAEDLANAGRHVYLATSKVGRYPWSYRGRELVGWLADCGFWDDRPDELADAADLRTAFGVVGSGGHSLDLPLLEGLGVTLLGRFAGADGERVRFSGSAAEHVQHADREAARLLARADAYISTHGLDAPAPDAPPRRLQQTREMPELDLAAAGITTVIWATGFTGDLSWVHLPIQDERGGLLHNDCASPVAGLWFAGLPWLTRRRSSIFYGLPGDAAQVRDGVVEFLSGG